MLKIGDEVVIIGPKNLEIFDPSIWSYTYNRYLNKSGTVVTDPYGEQGYVEVDIPGRPTSLTMHPSTLMLADDGGI